MSEIQDLTIETSAGINVTTDQPARAPAKKSISIKLKNTKSNADANKDYAGGTADENTETAQDDESWDIGLNPIGQRISKSQGSLLICTECDRPIIIYGRLAGKSTGIVTLKRNTHASPASAFAHCPNRDWEVFDDENFSNTEYARGCRDIADQLINNSDILDVVIGGGRTNFIPNTMADPEYPEVRGRRVDGRNLIEEWKAKMTSKGKTPNFVWSNNDFHNLSTNKIDNLLALLEPSHMHYEIDRIKLKLSEPSQQNGHHGTEARRALGDFASFDLPKRIDDTQIVVSADHSHVFTVGGYAYRNNDIFGFAANEKENGSNVDGMPFTSILYGNGPGYINSSDRLNKSYWNTVDLHSHDFKYHSAVPLNSESHGAEDVIVYASGPRSHLYTGTFEQSDIFHYMVYSMCLNEYSNDTN
ncbi:hypothetical protein GJ496_011636 [Pomphorhynchus laevis]|nr:hypothetical protein GJ496_011636 [Pomphorhynchus laevis]